MLAAGREQPADGDEQEGHELGHGGDGVQAGAERHAARVHERPQRERDHQHRHLGAAQCRHQRGDAGREHGGHGGRREEAEQPQHDPGEEARVRAERHADVGVGAPGQRHPAPRVGDAEHDQSHGGRTHEVGDRSRGTECAGDAGRQAEDAAADGDVDDGGGETERADRAHERLGPGGGAGHARVAYQRAAPALAGRAQTNADARQPAHGRNTMHR